MNRDCLCLRRMRHIARVKVNTVDQMRSHVFGAGIAVRSAVGSARNALSCRQKLQPHFTSAGRAQSIGAAGYFAIAA